MGVIGGSGGWLVIVVCRRVFGFWVGRVGLVGWFYGDLIVIFCRRGLSLEGLG